jgi:hypothetical protein
MNRNAKSSAEWGRLNPTHVQPDHNGGGRRRISIPSKNQKMITNPRNQINLHADRRRE